MHTLREQKKQKAKALIQEHALRLFKSQGYEATTVEQIAAAAEVSTSTFFRYFQTKEAVVRYDSLDPLIIASFRAQPRELNVVQALRAAMRDVFERLSPEKLALEEERFALSYGIPALRTTMVDEMARNISLFADMIAERTGREPSDLAVRNLAGAIIGVSMAALLDPRHERSNQVNIFDEALASLEHGLLTL